jgi:hypothetical protein
MPIVLGKISPSILAILQDAIFSAPRAEFQVSDHAPGYVFNPDTDATIRVFEAGYRFRQMRAPQLRAVADLLSELRS